MKWNAMKSISKNVDGRDRKLSELGANRKKDSSCREAFLCALHRPGWTLGDFDGTKPGGFPTAYVSGSSPSPSLAMEDRAAPDGSKPMGSSQPPSQVHQPPSPATVAIQKKAESLKWLSWNAAWHAANSLARDTQSASSDLAAFEEYSQEVAAALPANLAYHVRRMVWSACWHAANSRGAAIRTAAKDGYEAGDDDEEEDEGEEDEGEEGEADGEQAEDGGDGGGEAATDADAASAGAAGEAAAPAEPGSSSVEHGESTPSRHPFPVKGGSPPLNPPVERPHERAPQGSPQSSKKAEVPAPHGRAADDTESSAAEETDGDDGTPEEEEEEDSDADVFYEVGEEPPSSRAKAGAPRIQSVARQIAPTPQPPFAPTPPPFQFHSGTPPPHFQFHSRTTTPPPVFHSRAESPPPPTPTPTHHMRRMPSTTPQPFPQPPLPDHHSSIETASMGGESSSSNSMPPELRCPSPMHIKRVISESAEIAAEAERNKRKRRELERGSSMSRELQVDDGSGNGSDGDENGGMRHLDVTPRPDKRTHSLGSGDGSTSNNGSGLERWLTFDDEKVSASTTVAASTTTTPSKAAAVEAKAEEASVHSPGRKSPGVVYTFGDAPFSVAEVQVLHAVAVEEPEAEDEEAGEEEEGGEEGGEEGRGGRRR